MCTHTHTHTHAHYHARHRVQPESLMLMAAVLTSNDCARLQNEDGTVWRDIAYGFAMQARDTECCWDGDVEQGEEGRKEGLRIAEGELAHQEARAC